jgi:hypothetical protein
VNTHRHDFPVEVLVDRYRAVRDSVAEHAANSQQKEDQYRGIASLRPQSRIDSEATDRHGSAFCFSIRLAAHSASAGASGGSGGTE